MTEAKNEKQSTGKGFKKSSSLKALKGFRQSRGGGVIVECKKGDDLSKMSDSQKAILKKHGVI